LIPMEELQLLDDLVASARENPAFQERIAALEARRDRSALIALFDNPSDKTVVSPEFYDEIVKSIKYPKPATQALIDLMAADE
jgi:hypothetical protein